MDQSGKHRVVAIVCLLLASIGSVASGKVIYVDEDVAGANDGSSWADAFRHLQDALTAAAVGDEIRVAQGIYRPDQGAGVTPGDPAAVFHLGSGVGLHGGYAGLGADDPNARDAEVYQTILSGDLRGDDIEGNDDPLRLLEDPTRVENSLRVVHTTQGDGATILAGCTISGGSQGGLVNSSGSPSVRDCVFLRNSTGHLGGAVANLQGQLTLTRCRFRSNSATKGGGGLYSNPTSSVALVRCLFENNRAGDAGGAIRSSAERLIVTECTFRGNVGFNGGALEHDGDDSTVEITGCTFEDNTAFGRQGRSNQYAGGGALHVFSRKNAYRVDVTDCLFAGNATVFAGGAVFSALPLRVRHCRFIRNEAERGGGVFAESDADIANSVFAGNRASRSGGAIHNTALGNVLSNCTLTGNRALEGQGLACYPLYWPGDSIPVPFSRTVLSNCILWDGDSEIAGWSNNRSEIAATYSDVFRGWQGNGNIQEDPCFADAGHWDPHDTPDDPNDDVWDEGDYHLKSQAGRWDPAVEDWVLDEATSLCIDGGDPMTPIGHEPFPNGGIINMGAYGGTAEASKSYFGAPVCETIIAGDINGDCRVDIADYNIMALHWLDDTTPVPPPPSGPSQ